MLMYGWMVFVEHAPGRYDWAVKIMTGGRIDKIKDLIAEEVEAGMKVLDIGCGTGSLALRCIHKGAEVIGLDISPEMIEQAQRRAASEQVSDKLTLIKDSVTQIRKHVPDNSLDMVVSTMALGEFPRDYLDYILKDCMRILKPGGKLLIADEVRPENFVLRLLYQVSLVLLWVPQFLLLRRVFFPIKNLRGAIEAAGFKVSRVRKWAVSTFQLVFSQKAKTTQLAAAKPGSTT